MDGERGADSGQEGPEYHVPEYYILSMYCVHVLQYLVSLSLYRWR